jgi:hypothetical protein
VRPGRRGYLAQREIEAVLGRRGRVNLYPDGELERHQWIALIR